MIYVWLTLFTLFNAGAWLTNLLSLPGNWLIVLAAAVFAYFIPESELHGIGWIGIVGLAVLAGLGELLEFAASAIAVGKQGASRRAMVLSIAGTMVGSLMGAFVTIPIPILGPMVGALLGGALGALAGAWLGEVWKGKSLQEGWEVGKGAVIGKLLGTTGKLAVGALMVVVATVDAIW